MKNKVKKKFCKQDTGKDKSKTSQNNHFRGCTSVNKVREHNAYLFEWMKGAILKVRH